MHIRAKTGLAGLLGVASLLMTSAAFAGPTYFDFSTTWQDNSAESQWVDGNHDGLLDVGDSLRGILRIPTIQLFPSGATPVPATGANPDLTAIFETQILSKTADGGSISYCSAASGSTCTGTSTAATYNFTFGPSAAFTSQYGAGAMVAFFIDNSLGVSHFIETGCVPGAGLSCEKAITDNSSLYLTLGMNGSDVDEQWLALGSPDNPNLAKNFKSTDPLGTYNASLSLLTNNTGYNFFDVTVPTILATLFPGGDNLILGAAVEGSIEGNGAGALRNADGSYVQQTTVYSARDNTTLEFSAALPEPGTLMVFGFGLLGLGAMKRRRKSQS